MGKPIGKTKFVLEDYKTFEQKLQRCLKALEMLLEQPNFGCGNASIGAELELYLLDADERPLPHNVAIKKQFNDSQLTLELNRYNLEYNLTPVPASGTPFSDLEQQILSVFRRMQELTASECGHVLPIGILPTLKSSDFGSEAMTDEPRYHVLADALDALRDQSFGNSHNSGISVSGISIDGADAIQLARGDVTLEGACTSFQIHYRVDPSRFCTLWNSIQLITPLVLGVSANSPILMGHRLWHETRVPLFKQSIDGQSEIGHERQKPGRVSFGHGWLQDSPIELFQEMVNLYSPLIPICSDEDPIAIVRQGGTPALEELCLHGGTIWSWNRPIYDPEIDPHLRIEMRALPAGPTPIDMAANAALFIGLAEGLAKGFGGEFLPLLSALPFSYVEHNFYRAAQLGLNASVFWPSPHQNELQETPLIDVVRELLPVAKKGLLSIGVDSKEAERMLSIIENRLDTQCNGANWQLRQFSQLLLRDLGQQEICRALVTVYREQAVSNTPVSQWDYL